MKLYGSKIATCTQRVTFLLEELGVEYELCEVDLRKGEHKEGWYLEKQPFGKVPVLEDHGLVVFESRAIMRYIANKYMTLAAERVGWGDAERALVDNWMEVEAHNFNGPVSGLVYEKVFKSWLGVGEEDPAAVEKHMEALGKVLDVYEKVLGEREYLAGQGFSMADITHVPYMAYLIEKAGVKEPFESRPAVWAWWERVSGREAWKKVCVA